MRVLVLGGCGFIGSHVVDELLQQHHDVIVLDRNPERFRPPQPKVTYCQTEFGNRGELEKVLSGDIEVVIHLVSSTLPKTSNEDPIFDVQSNIVESLMLFEMCVKYGIRKVIFVSSGGTVYGVPQSVPIKEDHPTMPLCSYGVTKLAIENYLRIYHHLHGLNYTIFRLSNPYGPRQDPNCQQGVVPVFMNQILKGEEICIWGDGSIVRDFIHVKDVTRLCVKAVVTDVSGVFNVGSGQGISLNQLIESLVFVAGREPHVVREKGRAFDVPEVVLDCSLAKQAFFWSPEVDISTGLLDVRDWLLQQASTDYAFVSSGGRE